MHTACPLTVKRQDWGQISDSFQPPFATTRYSLLNVLCLMLLLPDRYFEVSSWQQLATLALINSKGFAGFRGTQITDLNKPDGWHEDMSRSSGSPDLTLLKERALKETERGFLFQALKQVMVRPNTCHTSTFFYQLLITHDQCQERPGCLFLEVMSNP